MLNRASDKTVAALVEFAVSETPVVTHYPDLLSENACRVPLEAHGSKGKDHRILFRDREYITVGLADVASALCG